MAYAFNGSIFAQQALRHFVANLTPLKAFSTDFSSSTVQSGTSVYVPLIGTLTATTGTGDYEQAGGVVTSVNIALNKYQLTPVKVTDFDLANNPMRVDQIAADAGRTTAKAVLTDILSVVTISNYAAATVTTLCANWTITQVLAMRAGLAAVGADLGACSLVVDETINTALLGTSAIYNASSFGSPDAIQRGVIPQLAGLPIFASSLIPANSISLRGFACHPSAVAVAMRYLKPLSADGYDMAEPVVDDQTGITLGFRQHYAPKTGALHLNLECVYGYAAGVTTGLVLATVP